MTATRRELEEELAKLLDGKTEHEKDLMVPCHCGAAAGKPCRDEKFKKGQAIVHIGRRIQRLLRGIR